MSKLRLLLLGGALGLTNMQVRQTRKTFTITSQLLTRRVGMWQEVFANPDYHIALYCVFLGRVKSLPPPIRDETLQQPLTPWMKQLLEDVQAVAACSAEVTRDLEKYGLAGMYRSLAFHTRKRLLAFELTHEIAHIEQTSICCDVCEREFFSRACDA
eukprot:TRINITY_DN37892_c0_g1_i1.p1 TRINITY_DN37892_c0_g1~~TRINITY_DN37892_c0_g1_i1.p1  ORF type:complete len:157 (-),score=21.08 TRINITY_DN37892_c0_g1_i1:10-480(-)